MSFVKEVKELFSSVFRSYTRMELVDFDAQSSNLEIVLLDHQSIFQDKSFISSSFRVASHDRASLGFPIHELNEL